MFNLFRIAARASERKAHNLATLNEMCARADMDTLATYQHNMTRTYGADSPQVRTVLAHVRARRQNARRCYGAEVDA